MSEEMPLERPELEEKLSELDILRQSLEASKEKQKEIFDQLLRLGAEFENFRKRSEVRLRESRAAGKEELLLPLLSLSDALAQADASAKNASDLEALRKGVSLLRQQFEKFLVDQGLTPIKAQGEKFDPLQHEAIAQEVTADKEEGVVVDELQRGYTMNGRMVRPARVRVTVRPKEAKAPAAVDESDA